jgi:acetyl-CoA C-acetyltransferase
MRCCKRCLVTVEDVVNSPMVCRSAASLDCCVITDGGGALIVTRPEIARSLKRPLVKVLGAGEAPKGADGRQGRPDLFRRALVRPAAFAEAGCQAPPTSSTPRSTTASPSPC